jgi:hypothetical protein
MLTTPGMFFYDTEVYIAINSHRILTQWEQHRAKHKAYLKPMNHLFQ